MPALVKTEKKSLSALQGAAANAVNDNKQYLTFMLGGEMFSLSILAIKEIRLCQPDRCADDAGVHSRRHQFMDGGAGDGFVGAFWQAAHAGDQEHLHRHH